MLLVAELPPAAPTAVQAVGSVTPFAASLPLLSLGKLPISVNPGCVVALFVRPPPPTRLVPPGHTAVTAPGGRCAAAGQFTVVETTMVLSGPPRAHIPNAVTLSFASDVPPNPPNAVHATGVTAPLRETFAVPSLGAEPLVLRPLFGVAAFALTSPFGYSRKPPPSRVEPAGQVTVAAVCDEGGALPMRGGRECARSSRTAARHARPGSAQTASAAAVATWYPGAHGLRIALWRSQRHV